MRIQTLKMKCAAIAGGTEGYFRSQRIEVNRSAQCRKCNVIRLKRVKSADNIGNMWTRSGGTLACESRRIVVSRSSGTISRAAGDRWPATSEFVSVGVPMVGILADCGRGGIPGSVQSPDPNKAL